MEDIHGIRPPVPVGFDLDFILMVLMITGAVLLVLLLIFFIRKWMKKKKTVKDLEALPPPVPPYEAALEGLDLLAHGQTGRDPRLFYFDLTMVFRKYVGDSFGINAVEMTTQEFIRHIRGLDMDKSIKKDIAGFQDFADPIKYAGKIPEKDGVARDIGFIRDKINEIENDLIKQKNKEADDV